MLNTHTAKTRTNKKPAARLLAALAALLPGLPAKAAEPVLIDLAGLEDSSGNSGPGWNYGGGTPNQLHIEGSGEYRVTGMAQPAEVNFRGIHINDNLQVTLYFEGVEIVNSQAIGPIFPALSIGEGANVTLSLAGDNILQGQNGRSVDGNNGGQAAIQLADSANPPSLTLTGGGSLTATGGDGVPVTMGQAGGGGAGIGGNGGNTGVGSAAAQAMAVFSTDANFTGSLTATGGVSGGGGGAGIGGGGTDTSPGGHGGQVTLAGSGRVQAQGGQGGSNDTGGAGIGGGGGVAYMSGSPGGGDGGSLTANGPTVLALGGGDAAGIGGGAGGGSTPMGGAGGAVSIGGGFVTAWSPSGYDIGPGNGITMGTPDTTTLTGGSLWCANGTVAQRAAPQPTNGAGVPVYPVVAPRTSTPAAMPPSNPSGPRARRPSSGCPTATAPATQPPSPWERTATPSPT